MEQKPIIFFDGVCHLCNGFVDFIVLRDTKHQYLFAPLQGSTATQKLPANDLKDLETVILYTGNATYKKSSAVLKVLIGLGGWYRLFGLCFLLPSPLRNWAYGWTARHRYAWFGASESCRLPTPEEKEFLLP